MGLTQGITELFPISSLGHSVLLPGILGWHNLVNSQSASESFFLAFIVGLHVGTALGLLVYYRKTWIALFRGLGHQLAGVRACGVASLWRLNEPDTDPNYRLLFILAVATVPVGIAGLLLEHKLRVLFAKPLAAAIFLTSTGSSCWSVSDCVETPDGTCASSSSSDYRRPAPSPSVARRSSRSSPG